VARYFVCLLMGSAVGVVYGLLQVRSPAPALMALVGLLDMTLGEQAIAMVKHHLTPPALAYFDPADLRRKRGALQPAALE
jgi:XapX domain-containing protein